MIEADVEGRLVRRVTKLGAKAIKIEAIGLRGFPDRMVIDHGGRVLFVETKSPTGRLSAAQKLWIGTLRRFGFRVEVPRTLEDVDALVEDFFGDKRKRPGGEISLETPLGLGEKERG